MRDDVAKLKIIIKVKHCHKPYLALKHISNNNFVSIAGSIDYNYLKKKYDIKHPTIVAAHDIKKPNIVSINVIDM